MGNYLKVFGIVQQLSTYEYDYVLIIMQRVKTLCVKTLFALYSVEPFLIELTGLISKSF